MLRRLLAAVAVAGVTTVVALGVPAQAAPTPVKPYDFDRNGHPDLTVGAPFLQVGSVRAAGGVAVLTGSSSGISTTARFITRDSDGIPGDPHEGDELGSAVASGDFDGDGYADLAIGQPYERVDGAYAVGGVTVVYGSRTGLDTHRSVLLQNPAGTRDADFFGASLAAADLDGDGYADLAVSSEGDSTRVPLPGTRIYTSGAVTILRGGPTGLGRSAGRVLKASASPSAYDVGFGQALATADLDRDGIADLVVGSRGSRGFEDDDEGHVDGVPGAVSVCRGATGLPASCTQVAFGRRYTGLTSLATGNVRGSATPEIVAGVPASDDVDVETDTGSVHVLELRGLTGAARDLKITQSSRGVPGTDKKFSEKQDAFGAAVAVGDLDRDGYADLVVGAPGEDDSRGRVTVVHGAKGGYRTSGNSAFDQDTKGIPSKAKPGERFGQALALDDVDGDGHLDLAAGGDDANKDVGGAVTTLRGKGQAFTTSGSRTFGAAALGWATPREAGFGEVVGG